MLIEQVKNLNTLDRLLYWITERESIRLKKESGEPKPWTDDKILSSFRFCNVRRADDRVSKWLLEWWYKPNFNHKNMLVACALARHFNLPAALEEIGFPKVWNPVRIKRLLRAKKARGENIFSGAYMVRGVETVDKTEMVVTKVCQPLVDNPPKIDTSSMQRSVEALLPYWGFSSFMAGQVINDAVWAIKGTWADRHTWAAIGPGSLKGMNQIHERPIKHPIKQEQFLEELRSLAKCCQDQLPKSITQRLILSDYQNCCCEYFKYTKALLGIGKPKQKYSGA
jgi:hypothetical protein